MKILQICSVPVTYPGGSEKVVLETSKELSKNHEVTILQTNLYREDKKFEEYSRVGKIKIITCKNDQFLGGYGNSKEFKKTLVKIWREYDVVHITGYGRFTSNFSLKYLYGKKPIIFSAHGFFHDKKHRTFKKIHEVLFKRLLKKSGICIALTGSDKEQFISRGVNKDHIEVIPAGIHLKKINKKNIGSLRKKYLGKDFEKKAMLYVGRIHKSKGLQYVVKAIKDLDLMFLIAGKDAGFKEELEKIIRKEYVENKIKFLGRVSDEELENLYSLSDFFILFSSWESFGIVVVEAMNTKKPVIVSDRGSLPELVKEGKTGFIIEYPNIKELGKKIKILIDNEKLRKTMGKNAQEFSKQFNWENIAKKYERLYKKVIEDF